MASDTAFKKTVLGICHSLSSYDIEQIVYLHNIPDKGETTTLSVLRRLEREGHFSSTQPEGLEALLRTIHRSDLCGSVQEYSTRYQAHSSCCRTQPCGYVSQRMSLCMAEAQNTYKCIADLQKSMKKFSDSQRRTPQADKFFRETGEVFDQLQSELSRFLISPLTDLHKHLCVQSNDGGTGSGRLPATS